MKIRVLWTNAQLRADNTTLTKHLKTTEEAHSTLFGRHLRQGGQLVQATALIASLRAELGHAEAARIRMAEAMDERDQEASGYLAQLNAKTSECEALAADLEQLRRTRGTASSRTAQMAVYPAGARLMSARDREDIADEVAFKRLQDGLGDL